MQSEQQMNDSPTKTKSLYRAITLSVIVLVASVTVVVNALSYFYSTHEEEALFEKKLAVYSGYLAESLEWPLWNIDTDLITKVGLAFSSNEEVVSLIVRDDDQKIVFQKHGSIESRFSRRIEIMHNGNPIGSAEIGLSSAELDNKNRQLLVTAVINTLALLIILLLLMRWILARLFKSPVNNLIGEIDNVVNGNYKQRRLVASHEEFAPILTSFKNMSDTVANREFSLRHANEQLAAEIAERKRAEEQLRFSESLLRQSQSIAKIGSWRLNMPQNELVWSDETYHMFDIPLGTKLTQQGFMDMVHPDDRELIDAAWQAALKGEPYFVAHRITVKGNTLWMEERAELEFDAQGQLLAGIGSVQDITDRKRAEAVLNQSEARQRIIIDATPIPLAINDARGNITFLNHAFIQTLGYTLNDIPTINDWWPRAYPDEQYRRWIMDNWQRNAEPAKLINAAMVPIEAKVQCKDDSQRVFLISATALTNEVFSDQLVVMYDITERKRSEDALLKLSQAVEQSPSSVVITDLEARIEYANAAYTTITGYTLDEVIGKNPRFLQSGKTPKHLYVEMWDTLTRGETWNGELINRRKDGSEYIESAQISPVRQADGKITHYLGIKENITENKKTAARMDSLAHFDQLTGLPNRVLLNDRSRYAMSLAQRNGEQLVVMFIDLDHFKDINDALGHSVGDMLLMEVSKRIKLLLREEDTVARLGGDEFILILPNTDEEGATYVATKLIEAISTPCQIDGHELITTPSIGIALYPLDGDSFEVLSKNADAAMYQVKQGGRNGFRFYTPEMQAHSSRNLMLANALRHALARNELELHYQPQLSMLDGRVIGAEALLRWRHPELGIVSPGEFIPIAEGGGMIIPIGEWVLRTAARQLKDWMNRGIAPMMMAVNLSSVQFRQTDLVDRVATILDEVGLPNQYLELELTEAVAMGDPQGAVAVMDKLHERGIQMSIDDFGTGYSSLSYLKKFKVYKLKIDQSFVRDITNDPDDKAIVTTIINMASSLGIKTIAEGVETAGQLAFLRLQGCDEAQGYYFSKPLPAEQFEQFINKARNNKNETQS